MRSLFSSYTEVTSIHCLLKYLSHEQKHILGIWLFLTVQHYVLIPVLIFCTHKTIAVRPIMPQEFKNNFSSVCSLQIFKKVTLPLRVIKQSHMARIEQWGNSERCFHPGTKRRYVFCFTHRPVCSWSKIPKYPTGRRLGGPQQPIRTMVDRKSLPPSRELHPIPWPWRSRHSWGF